MKIYQDTLSLLPFIVLIIIVVLARVFKKNKDYKTVLRNSFVSNYIVFAGLFYFFGHIFAADRVAKSIGWQPNSPFQKEVAVANLSFAIAAYYASTMTSDVGAQRTVICAYLVWMIGTLLVHAYDLVKNKNKAWNNAIATPLASLLSIVVSVYTLM